MGGNVFKNCVPFDQKWSDQIVQKVNDSLKKLNVRAIVVGSCATPTPGTASGDLDLMVEQNILGRIFNTHSPKEIRKKLKSFFKNEGFETEQSGINIHLNVPLGENYHQVDIMVVENAASVSKFHIHNIPEGSMYKGVNKHLALMYLAKQQNLLWSAYSGLYRRDSDGKRADLITQDIDQIAYILLGTTDSHDLKNFESIYQSMDKDQAIKMLETLKQDPSWKEF